MIIRENHGPFSRTRSYEVTEDDGIIERRQEQPNGDRASGRLWLSRICAESFLPFGYPASVTPDYTPFQVWDVLQDSANTLNASIAMESLFKAAGVGSENRTALAAVMALLVMDVAAKMGEACFVWSKGRALDYDNKKMRFVAAIFSDSALLLQLVIPLVSNTLMLMVLLCTSSIASAIAGIASGSTRMSLTSHQALANNSADVCSKSQAQRQTARLVCNSACLFFMPLISGNQPILLILHAILFALHLFFNYKACKAVQLKSLNSERVNLCLKQFLAIGTVPSVDAVNQAENLLPFCGVKDTDLCNFRVHLGASIAHLKNSNLSPDEPISKTLAKYEELPFFIIASSRARSIRVILRDKADPLQILEAYARCVIGGHFYVTGTSATKEEKMLDLLESTVAAHWETFKRCLEGVGYNLKHVTLHGGESRAKWKNL